MEEYNYHLNNGYKFLNSLVGAVPFIGTALNNYIVDNIYKNIPITYKNIVNNDIKIMFENYHNNVINGFDLLKHINYRLLHCEDIPTSVKVKYFPISTKIISDLVSNYSDKIEDIDMLSIDNKNNINNILKEINLLNYNNDNLDNNIELLFNYFNNLDKIYNDINNNIEDNLIKNNNVINDLLDLNMISINNWCDEIVNKYDYDDEIKKYKFNIDNNINVKDSLIMLKNRKLELLIQDKEYNDKLLICNNIIDSTSLIVDFCGNKKLSNKILSFKNNSNTIFKNILTISRNNIGIIPSISSVINIFGCINNIINLFSNDDNNMMEYFEECFKKIFEQLNLIRKEMHERFDKLDEKIDNLFEMTLNSFTLIQKSNNFITNEVILLNNKFDNFDHEIKYSFQKVNKHINILINNIKDDKNYKVLEKIINKYYIVTNGYTDNKKYIKIMNKLESYLNLLSYKYSNDNKICNDKISLLDFDFSINNYINNIKEDNTEEIPNLTISIISSFLIILKTIKQYPNKNTEPLLTICKKDIKRLKSIKNKFLNIKNKIIELREKSLLENITKKYNNNMDKLIVEINNFNKKFVFNGF